MVQLQHVGNGAKPGQEGGNLLEVCVSQLYKGGGREHSLELSSQNITDISMLLFTFGDITKLPC